MTKNFNKLGKKEKKRGKRGIHKPSEAANMRLVKPETQPAPEDIEVSKPNFYI